ncbi:hypothetical protein [Pseudarthrobacter sp. 1C304]|uniref:hypothetical protein n=1 Tax=Pseudarthrobacter sp. 1C304 TaxID=3457438 RepID=UPI003FD5CD13
MGDASKFWEIMATVIPVIALAFVVEVRYLRLDEMGPFRRLATSLAHAATILVLLFSELAALSNLAGTPQARWAELVALNGCAAGLAVVLSGPAIKFLIIGIYGTHPETYKGYWRVSRLLREHGNLVKQIHRQLKKNSRQQEDLRKVISALEARRATLPPARDLHTVWAREVNEDSLATARAVLVEVEAAQSKMMQQKKDAEKNQRKNERQIVKLAGSQTKRILREFERNQA